MNEYSKEALAAFRQRINTEIKTLETLDEAAGDSSDTVSLDQSKVGRLSRMDALQRQAMAQATNQRRQIEIAKLRQALKHIDEGSFGECTECMEPIDPRRVTHNPSVSLCIACAEAAEFKQ